MKSTPWPISVLKRIIVGLPVPLLALAFSKASSMASKSWPSAVMTFHPKALHFSSSASMAATEVVGPSICWPFQSVVAIRLSSLWNTAHIAASQIWPSSLSPSPQWTYTRLPSPSIFLARAMPAPQERPCPSEPEGWNTPGRPFATEGWPWRRVPYFLRVPSSSIGK